MSKNNEYPLANTRVVRLLTEFRVQVETETGTSITAIETDLGLALADVAKALGIEDPVDLLKILGAEAYLAAYVDPIPYQLPTPPHHAIKLLIAKLHDTWRGRWAGEPETEPC